MALEKGSFIFLTNFEKSFFLNEVMILNPSTKDTSNLLIDVNNAERIETYNFKPILKNSSGRRSCRAIFSVRWLPPQISLLHFQSSSKYLTYGSGSLNLYKTLSKRSLTWPLSPFMFLSNTSFILFHLLTFHSPNSNEEQSERIKTEKEGAL